MNDSELKDVTPKLYLIKGKSDECNHTLMNNTTASILSIILKALVEEGNSMSDDELNEKLYYILNLAPVLTRTKKDYLDLVKKNEKRKLLERVKRDLDLIVQWLQFYPIVYGNQEKEIARWHFDGCFGYEIPRELSSGLPVKASKVVSDGTSCSTAVANFDLIEYKRIRAAFFFEDLEQIDSRSTKLSVIAILSAFYIDSLYKAISVALGKVGNGYMCIDTDNIERRIDYTLSWLSGSVYSDTSSTPGREFVSLTGKKTLLRKYGINKKELNKRLIIFLDNIGVDFGIGTKRCKKYHFANIVFLLKKHMTVWGEDMDNYAKCKELLSKYYGIDTPTYKVSHCDAFAHSNEGQKLVRDIQRFCDEYNTFLAKPKST